MLYHSGVVECVDRYIRNHGKEKDEINNIFRKNKVLEKINQNIKNNNLYSLDKYNLPIRLRDKNKNTPYGWRMEGGEIININVDPSLISSCNNDIYELTKQKIMKKGKCTPTMVKIFKLIEE